MPAGLGQGPVSKQAACFFVVQKKTSWLDEKLFWK
jgi:hypothetical protein